MTDSGVYGTGAQAPEQQAISVFEVKNDNLQARIAELTAKYDEGEAFLDRVEQLLTNLLDQPAGADRPIARLNPKVKRALRDAMGHVARAEADQIDAALAVLDEVERTEAITLSILITCCIVVDACGAQWPDEFSLRQIAHDLAASGPVARKLGLSPGEVHTYLSLAVTGGKNVEDVIHRDPRLIRLPIIVAHRAAVVYSRIHESAWDYLDQIEAAIEAASALDESVLSAAVMRAYLPMPRTER
jgi:hypothetical protein